jgi:hypothetical protein
MSHLELRNVSKGYGGTEVLSDINLSIEEGEGFPGTEEEAGLLGGMQSHGAQGAQRQAGFRMVHLNRIGVH